MNNSLFVILPNISYPFKPSYLGSRNILYMECSSTCFQVAYSFFINHFKSSHFLTLLQFSQAELTTTFSSFQITLFIIPSLQYNFTYKVDLFLLINYEFHEISWLVLLSKCQQEKSCILLNNHKCSVKKRIKLKGIHLHFVILITNKAFFNLL